MGKRADHHFYDYSEARHTVTRPCVQEQAALAGQAQSSTFVKTVTAETYVNGCPREAEVTPEQITNRAKPWLQYWVL